MVTRNLDRESSSRVSPVSTTVHGPSNAPLSSQPPPHHLSIYLSIYLHACVRSLLIITVCMDRNPTRSPRSEDPWREWGCDARSFDSSISQEPAAAQEDEGTWRRQRRRRPSGIIEIVKKIICVRVIWFVNLEMAQREVAPLFYTRPQTPLQM